MVTNLSPEYRRLYEARKATTTSALDEFLQRLARSGITGRQLLEQQRAAAEKSALGLGEFEAELGAGELARKQSLEDWLRQTKQQEKMTFAGWAEQEKLQRQQFEQQEKMLRLQQEYAEEQRKKAEKDARKSLIRQTLYSTVLGGLTGGLAPAAMGVAGTTTGLSRFLSGFGRGAVMGAPTAGYTAATYPFLKQQEDWIQKFYESQSH